MCFNVLSMYVHKSKCVRMPSSLLHMNQTTACPMLEALLGVSPFERNKYYMFLEKKTDLELRPGLTLSCSPSSGVKTKVPPSPVAGVFVLRTVTLCLSSASVLCIVSALQNPGYITAAGSLNGAKPMNDECRGEKIDPNHAQLPAFLILFFCASLYDPHIYI